MARLVRLQSTPCMAAVAMVHAGIWRQLMNIHFRSSQFTSESAPQQPERTKIYWSFLGALVKKSSSGATESGL